LDDFKFFAIYCISLYFFMGAYCCAYIIAEFGQKRARNSYPLHIFHNFYLKPELSYLSSRFGILTPTGRGQCAS
jgi:hypothetical protein